MAGEDKIKVIGSHEFSSIEKRLAITRKTANRSQADKIGGLYQTKFVINNSSVYSMLSTCLHSFNSLMALITSNSAQGAQPGKRTSYWKLAGTHKFSLATSASDVARARRQAGCLRSRSNTWLQVINLSASSGTFRLLAV